MSEHLVVDQVSAANVKADVEAITTDIPSRLAGSPNAKRMAEYSAAALKRVGVAGQVHELPGLVSFPGKGEMRVLNPREIAIEANTLGHSLPTLPDGITAEFMDVGGGGFEAYEGRDATGKITLSELSYHPARHEKQRISGLMGAVGCVMMNWGHDGNTAVPFGSVKPVWGNPTPENYKSEMATLPCIGIARTAGLELREMLKAGPVRVWFRANVENGWRPVQITTGEIKGKTDDFIVVGGHQDSWEGPQATDNAAGSACIIELMRVFNQHRDKLRRGLVAGFWTGHETGTMIGSSWWVDRNWDRLRQHACAYVQIDQPGCAGTTTRWSSGSNAEMKRFHQAIEHRLLPGRSIDWHRAVKNGDSSFFGLGIPMLGALGNFTDAELKATAMASLGWWHHSIENSIDKLDFNWMQDHLRVYAGYLWELCTAPVLPFEFVTVADQIIERLEKLSPGADAVGLASVIAEARRFKQAATKLDTVAEQWRQRYATGASTDEGAADVLNACLKRLSRTLVPLASTAKGTYGHDPYGFTPQATMLPSLYDTPRYAKLPDNEGRWMLEIDLVRHRNRLMDGLSDCRALAEETVGKVG